MSYPAILTEDATLELCSTQSIARFGDGEWRCAVGGGCTSQRPDKKLAQELQGILRKPNGCTVALPNPFNGCPRRESWIRYTQPQYTQHLGAKTYGSAFITRPDNAPWIDRPDYWEKVRALWKDKDIVLVSGDKKSITTEMMGAEARSVREVHGPRQHAYAEIDRIEEDVGRPPGTVLICLGTAATVLAYRLAKKGVHALDLGHIGMFARHAGAYRYSQDDLTSTGYREQLNQLHKQRTWGADGAKHTKAVQEIIVEFSPATILDYGCGANRLAESLAPIRVSGYDPGIPDRAKMPKPCDLVVCTDVLEHVEPEKLDAVLDHLYRITGRVGYFVISTKPANAVLPNGRNAHLSIHPADWWRQKLIAQGWRVARTNVAKDLSVVVLKP
jgi:hypothetical protein